MRIVRYTSRCRRDYKREKAGRYGKRLDAELLDAVAMLAEDKPLPRRYFDHPLGGEWNDHRDCHIRPDLILIYRKPDDQNLDLVRLGSHSEHAATRPSGERTTRHNWCLAILIVLAGLNEGSLKNSILDVRGGLSP